MNWSDVLFIPRGKGFGPSIFHEWSTAVSFSVHGGFEGIGPWSKVGSPKVQMIVEDDT